MTLVQISQDLKSSKLDFKHHLSKVCEIQTFLNPTQGYNFPYARLVELAHIFGLLE